MKENASSSYLTRVLILVRHRLERSWWLENLTADVCSCSNQHHVFEYTRDGANVLGCVGMVSPENEPYLQSIFASHGPFGRIILFGYAGGCAPHVQKGDFILPTLLYYEKNWWWQSIELSPPFPPHEVVRKRIWFAPHLTVQKPLKTLKEKTMWYARTFAWSVDMESWEFYNWWSRKMRERRWKGDILIFRIIFDMWNERGVFSEKHRMERHRQIFSSRQKTFRELIPYLLCPSVGAH